MFFFKFLFNVFLCFVIVMFLLLLKHKRTKLRKYDAILFGILPLALFSICNIITVT